MTLFSRERVLNNSLPAAKILHILGTFNFEKEGNQGQGDKASSAVLAGDISHYCSESCENTTWQRQHLHSPAQAWTIVTKDYANRNKV